MANVALTNGRVERLKRRTVEADLDFLDFVLERFNALTNRG
jgi:hypothetical protein